MLCSPRSYLVVALVTAIATLLGTTLGVVTAVTLLHTPAEQPVVELPLYATSTDRGDSIAAATGPVGSGLDGLFVLDYKTGRLSLDVVNFLDGRKVGGRYLRANVHEDLKVEVERPDYLLLTANTRFGGPKLGDADPGNCIVYVIDQASARWAAYGFLWRPGLAKNGHVQRGELLLLQRGAARAEELQ